MLRWCCTYWFIGGTYVYKRCYQQDQLGSLQNRNSFGHLDNLCTAACSHWIPHTHRYLKIYKNWVISRNLLIQHEFLYYEIEWNGCNDNRVVRNQSEIKVTRPRSLKPIKVFMSTEVFILSTGYCSFLQTDCWRYIEQLIHEIGPYKKHNTPYMQSV